MGVKEEIEKDLGSPILKALDDEGLTPAFLAKRLKSELHAKETKVFAPSEKALLVILKTMKESGLDFKADAKKVLLNLLLYSKPLPSWDVRQKARQDAHKLRGDYPPDKQEHRFPDGPVTFKVIYEDKPKNGDGVRS